MDERVRLVVKFVSCGSYDNPVKLSSALSKWRGLLAASPSVWRKSISAAERQNLIYQDEMFVYKVRE